MPKRIAEEGQVKTLKRLVRLPFSSRLAIALSTTVVYYLSFIPLHSILGAGVTTLSLFPVVLVGIYFGVRWGLLTGLGMIVSNILLLGLTGSGNLWDIFFAVGLAGSITILLAGYAAGQIHLLWSRLENELGEHRKIELALKDSEARYRSLFEDSPISFWEEDFSEVKRCIDELHKQGIVDFAAYLKEHPEIIAECMHTIRVLDVNQATLKLYEAASKEDLVGNLERVLDEETLKVFEEEMLAIAHGKTEFEGNGVNYTLTGKRINIVLRWSIAPTHEQTLSRLIVTIADVTARWRAEEAEREQRLLAEALCDTAAALSGTLEYKEVLDRILANVGKVVPHDTANIMLVEGNKVRVVSHRGYEKYNALGYMDNLQFAIAEVPNLQRMAVEGRPLIVSDTYMDPTWVRRDRSKWIHSFAAAPIRVHDIVIGFLNVDSATAGFYHPLHAERLMAFADQAALAIANAKLFEKARKSAHQLDLLNDITRAAISASQLSDTLQVLADRLGELFGASGAYITLWDEANQQTIPAAAFGPMKTIYSTMHFPPDTLTLTWSVLKTARVLVAGDVFNSPFISPQVAGAYPQKSLMGLPLIVDGRKLGAALISYNEPHQFSPEEITLGEQVASQIALAVAKVQLLEAERERTRQLSIANAMISALGHVAARIENASAPDEVMQTLGRELEPLGMHCLIALRQHNPPAMSFRHVSLPPFRNAFIEKWAAMKLKGLVLPPDRFPFFAEVIERRQAMYVVEPQQLVLGLLPKFSPALTSRVVRMGGLTDATRAICLPLIADEVVIGCLVLWGDALREEDLPAMSLFASQVAITLENTRLYTEVQQLAITDDLTGLYNRRGLFELGRHEIDRSQRFNRSFSVLMVDIDWFKQVNDTYTHAIGDQVLKVLADRCRQTVRTVDIIARLGGEEFVILLLETGLEKAVYVAERLRLHIGEQPIPTDVGLLTVTVSIGVAELTAEIDTLAALIEKADQAMYLAKQSGRNCVAVKG